MKKIIILNGPPSCGKDTAAHIIQDYLGSDTVAHLKYSAPLKAFAANIAGISVEELERNKESEVFKNFSGRDLQIIVFNELARSLGQDWLGQILAREIQQEESDYIVVSDGGRPEDIAPLFRNLQGKEIMIAQIMRNGCSFSNDIRMYLSDNRAIMQHVVNSDLETYRSRVRDMAASFYGEDL
jgi:hypothetical protein